MSQKGIEARIREIGEEKTLLEIENQRLVLSSGCLPEKSLKGGKLKLYLVNSEEGVSEKKLAKIILEEILNGK